MQVYLFKFINVTLIEFLTGCVPDKCC